MSKRADRKRAEKAERLTARAHQIVDKDVREFLLSKTWEWTENDGTEVSFYVRSVSYPAIKLEVDWMLL